MILLNADNIDALRNMSANSIDALATDPPYGLSDPSKWDLPAILSGWITTGCTPDNATGPGFMGNQWDHFVPPPALWREVYRVMKPGAYGVVFAATRCEDLMGMSLRLGGFEIRDVVDWLYGVGFPKSHKVPGQPGYGTGLKPMREPIFLIRKPPDGSIGANVARWGTGGINIDGCRVATDDALSNHSSSVHKSPSQSGGTAARETHMTPGQALGRWPGNAILTHGPDCVHVGQVDAPSVNTATTFAAGGHGSMFGVGSASDEKRAGGILDVYDCAPGCPVGVLDEQSGPAGGAGPASGPAELGRSAGRARGVYKGTDEPSAFHGKAAGASAFFYVTKPARSERDQGLEHLPDVAGFDAVERTEGSAGLNNPRAGAGRTAKAVKNFHPTVKPVALMRYLINLVTPPGDGRVVLDPFAGSGTTGVAGILEGVDMIMIEREAKYIPLIQGRCEAAQPWNR